jgi:hypothetical protein
MLKRRVEREDAMLVNNRLQPEELNQVGPF